MRRRRSALTGALSSWCPWSSGRVNGEAPSLVIRHSPRRYRTQDGACRDVPRSPAHTGRLLSGRKRNQGGRSMVKFSRRSLLQAAAATTGGVVLSGGLDRMIVQAAGGKPAKLALQPVADLRDGIVRLNLPSNFQYRSFHDTDGPAITLNDGTVLPGRHDGMGAFSGPNGNVWLVRNHEVTGTVAAAFGPGTPYDTRGGGGTTTTEVTPDGRGRERVHESERHDEQLFRWRHAVGIVDHLRGNGQRPRRRSRFHPRAEHLTHAAARVHLRGTGRRAVGPHADHVGGPIRARGSGVQPGRGHRVSHRGQLRVPLRSVPIHPAHASDDGRSPPQWRPAPDAPSGGNARSAPREGALDRGVVRGRLGRHRRSQPDVPVRPGCAGSDQQRRRPSIRRQSGSGAGGCRLLPSRGRVVHEG